MSKVDKQLTVDYFVDRLGADIEEFERFLKFIYFQPNKNNDTKKAILKGTKIINEKIRKIKEADSLDEKAKYCKVKKICKTTTLPER